MGWQWIKTFAAKLDNLSLIPGAYVEGGDWLTEGHLSPACVDSAWK